MISWFKCMFLELPAEYSHDANFFVNNDDNDNHDEFDDIDNEEYDDDEEEEEEEGLFFMEWVSMMKEI